MIPVTKDKIHAIIEVVAEPNITVFVLQNLENLDVLTRLDDTEAVAEILGVSETEAREDVERIYTVSGIGDKRVMLPHPQKMIQFCNKYHLLMRPSMYNDMCAYYCETVYLTNPMFSQEAMLQMMKSCEDKELDMFPAPCNFPTKDLLEIACRSTYTEIL